MQAAPQATFVRPTRREALSQEELAKRLLFQVQNPDVVRGFLGKTRKEKEQMLLARGEQLRRQARQDVPGSLAAHARLLHRDDTDTPLIAMRHHAVWAHYLEQRERYPWLCIVAPPGYAKSTWISWAYPAWRIGVTRGQVRIGLVANTHTLARAWSSATQAVVESQGFRDTYGVQPNYDRAWRDVEWATTGTVPGPNYTFTAMGMNGQVQSRRFDEIIVDDPTTWQQALSEDVLSKQRLWFKNTLLKRLPIGRRPPHGTGGRVTVVLTRWSARDLVPMLKDVGFHVVHMPALGYWDGTIDPVTGKIIPGIEPLWGEQESYEQIEAEREALGDIIFELVMQGNTDVLSGDYFSDEWFQYDVAPPRAEFDRVITGVDTSGGKDRRKGDFFAAVTIGLKGRQVWVLNVFRDIIPAPEQVDAVVQQLSLWAPDLLVIEDTREGTALLQTLLSMHLNQAMKGVVPIQDKEWRARGVAQAFKAGLVTIAATTDEDGDLRIPKWALKFSTELQAFPDGSHDDQVDGLAHAYNELSNMGPRARAV